MKRQLITELDRTQAGAIVLKGWIRRIRETKSTTFIVLQDCSGIIQLVANPADVKSLGLRAESAVAITGTPRIDERAPGGIEVDCHSIEVLNPAAEVLPFTSISRLDEISPELAISHRPLALRTDRGGAIFRIEAALAEEFRAALRRRNFTEIFTSKIVASATEGGTNLFAIKYFDRAAYLAQSPQFYKEHAVAGLERVFETGHVYRAEPHASSRHLCEYLSLDLELGFIDGLGGIIELEREVLTEVFAAIRERYANQLAQFDSYLPSLEAASTWTFDECLDRLRNAHGRSDLVDDLDPMAERQLCEIAKHETDIAAIFVTEFPLSSRPFYTHPARDGVHGAGFDLLLRGLEVTTGGQRLHRRADLEAALNRRGIASAPFQSHLKMFDLGMPPHGGLAIGLERLTCQVLGLKNIREATLYPRDLNRLEP
ncbi:MAG TPA: aspartate--tRNA(Asn) ligase [Candidatus Binataceae bacterium]|nr:aspartate--tRNA(Asn) ligase [Candidatus Binataceae bacterium]